MATVASSTLTAGAQNSNGQGTTALVLEYLCLFTHDLRRKQKRWQDGRLKYHTYNNRVMVFDERGNSVGDMHWHADWAFDEGEEIQLDRGGVMVQVSECVGRQMKDLSELVDKRVQEKEQRQAMMAVRSTSSMPTRPSLAPSRAQPPPPDHFQMRHRPLLQVIGNPTGHLGRSHVSSQSPFEQRKSTSAENGENVDQRASKRRRYEEPQSKKGYAQNLFGAMLSLSGGPTSSAATWRQPSMRGITLENPLGASSSSSNPVEAESSLPPQSISGRAHEGPGHAQEFVERPVAACQPEIPQQDSSAGRPLNQTSPRALASQEDSTEIAPKVVEKERVAAPTIGAKKPQKTQDHRPAVGSSLNVENVGNPQDQERASLRATSTATARTTSTRRERAAGVLNKPGEARNAQDDREPMKQHKKPRVREKAPDTTKSTAKTSFATAVPSERLTEVEKPHVREKAPDTAKSTAKPSIDTIVPPEGLTEVEKPQAKLRLKSRQRSGLLLVSERSKTITTSRKPTLPATFSARKCPAPDGDEMEPSRPENSFATSHQILQPTESRTNTAEALKEGLQTSKAVLGNSVGVIEAESTLQATSGNAARREKSRGKRSTKVKSASNIIGDAPDELSNDSDMSNTLGGRSMSMSKETVSKSKSSKRSASKHKEQDSIQPEESKKTKKNSSKRLRKPKKVMDVDSGESDLGPAETRPRKRLKRNVRVNLVERKICPGSLLDPPNW
jgi:hypothetical protein